MSPQRRTALVSIVAACVLIAVKLIAGIATGSLGLLSEAAHSGTDLIAALLTFVAVGVSLRPADVGHAYGHGKAEHLAALGEAAILVIASLAIAWQALLRLFGVSHGSVDAHWYALVVMAVVIIVDATRATASYRTGKRYGSAALQANALHFASDLAGSTAVLLGLIAARAGYQWADSAAALFVAFLVLVAAGRLMRLNVDVLMDRVPPEAQEAALAAIASLEPRVELRRLRMRQAGGRQFADVVIGVPPGAAVGQGHAAADAVEDAVHRALPESDVVVHVEPQQDETALRERILAAAQRVPRVREIHNLTVVRVGPVTEVSLHLKLPGDLPLEEAHAVATEVEREIVEVRARGGRGADASRAAGRRGGGRQRARGRRRPRARRADRAREDRLAPARAPVPGHRSRAARVPHAGARPVHVAGGGAHARERDRRADPPRASRHRRRHRAHGAVVRLCMFTPLESEVRGWPGVIEGDRVIQLAAQTLEAFFTGGGQAREHAEYPLDEVRLLAPVRRPPSVRDFYAFEEHVKNAARVTGRPGVPDEWYEIPAFYFSNPAAIYGPEDEIPYPEGSAALDYELEVAAVIGAAGAIGGFTVMNDWSARDLQRREMKIGLGPAKGKDFATSLGPIVVTPDELGDLRLEMVARVNGEERSRGNLGDMYHSWEAIVAHAARNTELRPGDILGSGTVGTGCILEHGDERWLQPGDEVELEVEGIGVLKNRIR